MLILASASPRRRDLLQELGVEFQVQPSPVDELEEKPEDLAPAAWAEALAYYKARRVAEEHPGTWVLAADTLVSCAGELLGKPRDEQDARRMLELQARAASHVITGVSLVRRDERASERYFDHADTEVWMHDAPDEREAYLRGGEWAGKAGAYGIQDVGDKLVRARKGSFSNVVGLPMERLEPALQRLGLVN